jgi:hypothetical protein
VLVLIFLAVFTSTIEQTVEIQRSQLLNALYLAVVLVMYKRVRVRDIKIDTGHSI